MLANLPTFERSISMLSLARMTGSLHVHNFYIGKLKAKQDQLSESAPEAAMLLDNVVAILSEHAIALAEDIADKEFAKE
ncbi:hypothetical protein IE4771_CH00820 [Rhizobium etli bv. mimosae str. IE4771]|uniref:Uncharacterized protein n=1 Tax=Rhizobium etli bv. mimosae str. IE4771 TaxID=1432050 RepID=A0A060I242_RHIET|nr:hypothetical protein [Rhizobium sp. IE4771]AIC25975.1 hypothetical protein IE4771_CH00820 [Rhizobium sp. IE4771]